MTKVAINQSSYLPWKGYFDLIHDVDLFIFYDDVQFTKNDWRNRNKVKGAGGSQWFTVPVGDHLHRLICDVAIKDHHWQIKHWKTLSQLYARTPHFKDYRAFFEHVYLDVQWENLSQLNQHLIETIAGEFLGTRTKFLQSSVFERQGVKQDAVISLLKAVGADLYVSGPAAQAYLQPERFRREGIQLVWKDYSGYPEYTQVNPPFDHHVTILDVLFHTGRDAPHYIWGWREDGRLGGDVAHELAAR